MSASQREDRTRLEGFELEIFKLVRKGATSEQWREWLRVPLEHAAAAGDMKVFSRLMDAGANGSANWRGCLGRTLLGAAAQGKNEEMVQALLRAGTKDDIDIKFGVFQQSALHVAAAHGAKAVSRALVSAGADSNLLDFQNQTPLHLAAENGHDGVVSDLLMVSGADPNAENISQETPLHLAAAQGRLSCVSKLLLGGAEKNRCDEDGETPLHRASGNNQVGVVEELLAANADVDIRAGDKLRPLDVAACWGRLEVLRTLLRHGGDVKAGDDNGYTALHHVADVHEPDHDNAGSVRVLLEAGADVEAKTTHDFCKTPLHIAAIRRFAPSRTICALLEGGADVNARDSHRCTPLHYACCESNVGGVELLLRWGADETLMDADGDTAVGCVGAWEEDDEEGSDYEERKADDLCVRLMLARAPADRSWRRCGWLVLARSRPARVQFTNDGHGNNGGSSAKVARGRCSALGVDGGGDGEQAMIDLGELVRRVVGLDVEGLFRLVVSFL